MADSAEKRAQLKAKFKTMDKNGDGKLDFNEFLKLMHKLDEKTAETLFKKVDTTGDGTIDFDEFVDYIYSTDRSATRSTDGRQQRLKFLSAVDAANEEDPGLWDKCKVVFDAYQGNDEKFESRDLQKLCVDCLLFDRKFKRTDVDVIFVASKARDKKTINFEAFKDCIRGIAKKKNCSVISLQAVVAAREDVGVQINATQADAVRFHDDKSTYTGMHARGGAHGSDVSGALTRSDKLKAGGTLDHSEQEELPWEATNEAFNNFCKGDIYLDSREFTQMCEDCSLYNERFKRADADITFNKVKNRGERTIDFEQFKDACIAIATKRGGSVADVQRAVEAGKIQMKGVTEAEFVRFHDDKSTFTGVHVAVHNADQS